VLPSRPRARVKRCTPPSVCLSVCPSDPCLRFSRNRKSIEYSTMGSNCRSKRRRSRTKSQTKTTISKRPILSSNIFHQRKYFVFVTFVGLLVCLRVCHIPHIPHIPFVHSYWNVIESEKVLPFVGWPH